MQMTALQQEKNAILLDQPQARRDLTLAETNLSPMKKRADKLAHEIYAIHKELWANWQAFQVARQNIAAARRKLAGLNDPRTKAACAQREAAALEKASNEMAKIDAEGSVAGVDKLKAKVDALSKKLSEL